MPNRIKIGHKYISKNDPICVIAEIGSNHNQDIKLAKKLIDVAAGARADAVKFQLFDADELYKPGDELYDIFKEIELDADWLVELKTYAESKNLIFFASPFDEKSIHLLEDHGVSLYKWASSETTNLKNLRIAASYNKPMIISTGMCDLADIYEAVEVCKTVGNYDLVLLHTSSLYPTEPEDSNVNSIKALKRIFNLHVGFSDHTMSSTAAVVAVAYGATVIEKHITLDKKMKGPDHFYAAEPEEFKSYVQDIRTAEKVMGSDKVEMHPDVKEVARRVSIYAAVDIEKGSLISENMLQIKRPGAGIRPRYMTAVIGARAKEKIGKHTPINWGSLSLKSTRN